MTGVEARIQAEYLLEKIYKRLCNEAMSYLDYEGKEVVLDRFFKDTTAKSPVDTMQTLLKDSISNHHNEVLQEEKRTYAGKCHKCLCGNGEGGCTMPFKCY